MNIQKYEGPSTWQEMKEQAQALVNSGMLPDSIRSPQAALAIMQKGKEINVPPMMAFSHINVIKGKPTISPELMLSLIYRMYPQAAIDFAKYDNNICEIHAARPGGKTNVFKFDMNDAKQAGLASKSNWKTYPRAMLRSRCVAEMARSLFPDAIMGCSYTPEELGGEMAVDDSGQIESVSAPEVIYEQIEADVIEEPKEEPERKPGLFTGNNDQKAILLKLIRSRTNMPEVVENDFLDKMMNQPSSKWKDIASQMGFTVNA